jgi:hypothetical protein
MLIPVLLLAAACGDRPADSDAMDDMAMPAMDMPSMTMVPAMRAYLDSVTRVEPGDVAAMRAAHSARIEEALAAMDHDMAAMDMTADSAWRALADSVRGDLTTLPALNGEPLLLYMRAHAGRMRRLLGLHERMMGTMAM